ncbi:MAG: hypothetical protein QW471_04155 [Candidatus Woesearchaeota archaeon]
MLKYNQRFILYASFLILIAALSSMAAAAPITFSTHFLAPIAVASLSRDSFVIAYCDNTSAKVAFQIYRTNGTQLLAERDVDTTLGTNPCGYTSVAVSAFNSTHFVIGWIDSGSSYASFQVFDINGNPYSSRVDVDTTAGTSRSVSVSAFNSSAFVFGWYDQASAYASFRTFSSSGVAISSVVNVDTTAGTCNAVSVSAVNSSAFVFGWYDQASSDMTFRTYTSSGVAISAVTDVNTKVGTGSFSVSVAAYNSSAFVIVWYDQRLGYVSFRQYSVAGVQIGSQVNPDTAVGTTASGVFVSSVGVNSSVFAVGWNDLTTDVVSSVRTYSGAGAAVSSEVVVQANALKYNALAGYYPATGIRMCDNAFVIAISNTSTQAFFTGYYANGTNWNGICTPPNMNSSKITSSEDNFYYNATLIGWCNATHPDSQNISYYYNWYLNGLLNKSGQTQYSTPGVAVNVDNITSSYLSIGQNWTLECIAYDGLSNSTPLNSTAVTIVDINRPPLITSILLDDDILAPSFQIDLSAGSTKRVNCNGTIQDPDGISDIVSISAVLYASGNGTLPTFPEDNNTLYRNYSCSLSQINLTSGSFNCSFALWYYAQNGTWTCNVTINDTKSHYASAIINSTVNELVAFEVFPLTVDYGNMAPGSTSASSTNLLITNMGNTKIDLILNGTNMSCTLGFVGASNQHYNLTGFDQEYSNMRALTELPFTASDFDLQKRVTSEANRTAYWRVQIPTGVKGRCLGIIQLTAQKG